MTLESNNGTDYGDTNENPETTLAQPLTPSPTFETPEDITEPSIKENVVLKISDIIQNSKNLIFRIETANGTGSAICVTSYGYLITCSHVTGNNLLVRVVASNERVFEGIVISRDENRDIALVAIIHTEDIFEAAVLGRSADTTVGDEVIAIGYSLGLEGTATSSRGIVSAKRFVEGMEYIQTDAAINPGNSGGPLFNLQGEVIGINAAKFVGGGVEGIGLAVPIDEVKDVFKGLLNFN